MCTWSADLVMEKIFRMGKEEGEISAWFYILCPSLGENSGPGGNRAEDL